MEASQPPMDETVWAAPQYLAMSADWDSVHTNSILHYFSWSPFFDPTSNNNILVTQAGSSKELFDAFYNRQLFEGRLRSMQGLEFMVIEDPSEGGTRAEHSGVWVIRKQYRKKIKGEEDEVTPIACYIVMGESIFMAPTIGDVLGSRLISTMASLNKFFSTASTLPLFTPSIGHTWYRPTAKPVTAAMNARPGQSSKEGTPMPGTPAGSVDSSKVPLAPKATSGSGYQELQTLAESYHLSRVYENEYMDENPLVGEPGSFRITKTKEVVPKPVLSVATPFNTSPADGKMTESPIALKKVRGGEKSPITPGTKEKKSRRKSKAASAAATTTPK